VSETPLYFEDFRVGMSFEGAPRTVTASDHETFMAVTGDRGAVHRDPAAAAEAGFESVVTCGPLGIGVVFGQLYDLGIVEPTAIATLDLEWSFFRPVLVGDVVRARFLVTRCRRSTSRRAGVVARHIVLLDADGDVRQGGTSSMLVQARADSGDDRHAVATDFGTVAWAELLVAYLGAHDDFRGAVDTFDGSIGLQAGRESVQLRVYRGEVLDVARTTPHGATFTLCGSERAWTELALGSRNDFLARTSRDEFWASGDMFEYLRMTKALVALWDGVRALAGGESS
jgi:acyl dehydratase